MEVKGRISILDQIKQSSHPEVIWFFQEDINKMRKELDQQFPGWEKDFIRIN